MRPGIDRLYGSRTLKNAACGPPKNSGTPNLKAHNNSIIETIDIRKRENFWFQFFQFVFEQLLGINCKKSLVSSALHSIINQVLYLWVLPKATSQPSSPGDWRRVNAIKSVAQAVSACKRKKRFYHDVQNDQLSSFFPEKVAYVNNMRSLRPFMRWSINEKFTNPALFDFSNFRFQIIRIGNPAFRVGILE